MHGRMQRHDAVAEQVAEAGQLLERRHRDALVGKDLRRAARREQLDTERRQPRAKAARPALSYTEMSARRMLTPRSAP